MVVNIALIMIVIIILVKGRDVFRMNNNME
jgi:hypothetical protein